ncbi:hypothetical protein [Roseomonas sp. CECT 9278]|uniref:hypothetical protein n=1 Tax=Roseomonas sp. CECT 9278 TaxID=2845823 RepID=UPI001E48B410|nr:hypothetical protein [Roseomonas sp. CECT 9278]
MEFFKRDYWAEDDKARNEARLVRHAREARKGSQIEETRVITRERRGGADFDRER